jgi:hypothetical protein
MHNARHYPHLRPASRVTRGSSRKKKALPKKEQPEFIGQFPTNIDETKPLSGELLFKIFESLIDTKEHMLLMPQYPHEFADKIGLRKEYDDPYDDTLHELIFDDFTQALYSIQDASGNWWTPDTSGLTIGAGYTDQLRLGDDGFVYLRGIFPESMVKDGKKMPGTGEESDMGDRRVYVQMRINPSNVSTFLLNEWITRLNKHVSGFDPETGTWMGPKGEFESKALGGEFFPHGQKEK